MGRGSRRPCRAAVHLLLVWGLTCLWALDNGVGDVPAMGWNSWNQFRCDINEGLIREVARAMVSSGLRDAGYRYVNIDDGWLETNRTADGLLQPAANFPGGGDGMRNLSAYLRSRGLRFGIYNSNSMTTCMKRAGGLYTERLDARTYADWGVDYLCASPHPRETCPAAAAAFAQHVPLVTSVPAVSAWGL